MTQEQKGTRAQFKGIRSLAVRFTHAPCVKITLKTVTTFAPAPENVRFLRLGKAETLIQVAA